LEALLRGRRMLGDLPRPTAPDLRTSGDLPRPTAPDLRSPPQPLMAGRAMGTAQGPTRTPRSSILPREDGAGPNRTVINFAGRHSGDRQLASFVTASIPLVWSHRTIGRTSLPAVRPSISFCGQIGLLALMGSANRVLIIRTGSMSPLRAAPAGCTRSSTTASASLPEDWRAGEAL
jgi:hypothetical protein